MSLNRSLPRNVKFYDAGKPDEPLGGLFQNGSITEANFLHILTIILVVEEGPILVQERESSHIVSRTDMPLGTGAYDIYCDASIQVSNEPWIHRHISHNSTARQERFRIEIRQRDQKCVITGFPNPEHRILTKNWGFFEACHIFPLRHESHWIQYDYGRWITDMEGIVGSSKINSIQNGFLLQRGVHRSFDQYLISVNPDDCYKILDPVCRNSDDPHRVSKQLLRWHFRQSVLANMRGGAERILEDDFLPGTDMADEILDDPFAQERFELERAGGLQEIA
ncbi:HNH endonuclease-domain-containing protein [Tuber indicum]|nr:HNH endonuclease-domain-containing protein [Tuber indicum]